MILDEESCPVIIIYYCLFYDTNYIEFSKMKKYRSGWAFWKVLRCAVG